MTPSVQKQKKPLFLFNLSYLFCVLVAKKKMFFVLLSLICKALERLQVARFREFDVHQLLVRDISCLKKLIHFIGINYIFNILVQVCNIDEK